MMLDWCGGDVWSFVMYQVNVVLVMNRVSGESVIVMNRCHCISMIVMDTLHDAMFW